MPRVSLCGFTLLTRMAPPLQRSAAGCTRGWRYSSETVMCAVLSTRRLRKSFSEPRMSDDTARKKATPRMTPESETSVWRLRLVRWPTAMSRASMLLLLPRGPALLQVRGRGVDDARVGREAVEDLGAPGAGHADLHLLPLQVILLVDRPDAVLLHGRRGYEEGVLALGHDEVG